MRRDKTRDEVEVKLAAPPDDGASQPEPPRLTAARDRGGDALGIIEVESITTRNRNRLSLPADIEGVVITEATAGGSLARALGSRIPPEDILIEDLNGVTIETPEEYGQAIAALEPGDVVSVRLLLRTGPGGWQSQILSVEVSER